MYYNDLGAVKKIVHKALDSKKIDKENLKAHYAKSYDEFIQKQSQQRIKNIDCKNEGKEVSGVCVCIDNYFGEECEFECQQGSLEDGFCQCNGPECNVSCSNGYYDPRYEPTQCHCQPGYMGDDCSIPCVNGKLNEDKDQCECDLGYMGTACNIPCYKDQGEVDTGTGACTCKSEFGGKQCQFKQCHRGVQITAPLQPAQCTCFPDSYTSGTVENVSCEVMRDTICQFDILQPESKCQDHEIDANKDAYCIQLNKGEDIQLTFGIRCELSTSSRGSTATSPLSSDADIPTGDDVNNTPYSDYITVRNTNQTVRLWLRPDVQISVEARTFDFFHASDNKLMFYQKILSKQELTYSLDTDGNIQFTSPITVQNRTDNDSLAMNYLVTDRMSMQLTGHIIDQSSLPGQLIFKQRWLNFDFMNLGPGKYKPPPIDTFLIVIIILVSLLFIVALVAIIVQIVTYILEKKEEKLEQEKRDEAERIEHEERKKRRQQRRQRMRDGSAMDNELKKYEER
ncbi:MAG: hypothetical protein EZS28_017505 [Streblomastix strix]|uniref:EGF-like domain-containing protein n=1 Tax=Streblomastix strix TaxID=222440 RepID=A0A5J4VWF2_9EUKA|nr:MAG: hypothetical protein EZS28_017505 [Streblomastix strix]